MESGSKKYLVRFLQLVSVALLALYVGASISAFLRSEPQLFQRLGGVGAFSAFFYLIMLRFDVISSTRVLERMHLQAKQSMDIYRAQEEIAGRVQVVADGLMDLSRRGELRDPEQLKKIVVYNPFPVLRRGEYWEDMQSRQQAINESEVAATSRSNRVMTSLTVTESVVLLASVLQSSFDDWLVCSYDAGTLNTCSS